MISLSIVVSMSHFSCNFNGKWLQVLSCSQTFFAVWQLAELSGQLILIAFAGFWLIFYLDYKLAGAKKICSHTSNFYNLSALIVSTLGQNLEDREQ